MYMAFCRNYQDKGAKQPRKYEYIVKATQVRFERHDIMGSIPDASDSYGTLR